MSILFNVNNGHFTTGLMLMAHRYATLASKVRLFAAVFLKARIFRAAAAVSYYLTLAFFPFLIILHWMFVTLGLKTKLLADSAILPGAVRSQVGDYISYIAASQSPSLFFAAVIILVTSLSGALRTILVSMEDLSGTVTHRGAARYAFSFLCSFGFLFITFLFMLITVAGKAAFVFIDNTLHTGLALTNEPEWVSAILLFLFLFFILMLLYSVDKKSCGSLLAVAVPAAIAAAMLVAVGQLFSGFIEHSARYPLVYGYLTSIIFLILWLYVCANIILGGSVLTFITTNCLSVERNSQN